MASFLPAAIDFSTLPFMYGLGICCAVAATVLLFIFILPEKKCKKLPKVFGMVRDIFTFKDLLLETILKALYAFTTFACIFAGFFMLFGFTGNHYSVRWYGGYGLLLIIAGPIVARIVYEIFMMFVILVKNTMDINKKMKTPDNKKSEDDQQ